MAARWRRLALLSTAWSATVTVGVAALGSELKELFGPSSGVRFLTVSPGVLGMVGNTPLVEIPSLSEATGCRILAKAEFLNPGGSVKDRAAKLLVEKAEEAGLLNETTRTIVEGTGGNTGVGLSMVAAAKGYNTILTLPARTSIDKTRMMELFGGDTRRHPAVPFTDDRHYYQAAKNMGKDKDKYWPDQFENVVNAQAHYEGTAPEIWRQTRGSLDAFCCASGTGGTIGGCSQFFREKNKDIQLYLIDPDGSSLASLVKTGELKPSPGNTLAEGIGIGRQTANFSKALPNLNGVIQVHDQEAIDMSYYLLEKEGLFVGPSAALNIVGAVKLAKKLGKDKTIVTVLCDCGERYNSTIYNQQWLKENKVTVDSETILQRLMAE